MKLPFKTEAEMNAETPAGNRLRDYKYIVDLVSFNNELKSLSNDEFYLELKSSNRDSKIQVSGRRIRPQYILNVVL
jgi:hypothetical protein